MNLKFQSNLNKKGYLQIDFIFAIFIFFVIFFMLFTTFSSQKESIKNTYDINRVKFLAKDFCYSLTSSMGYPSNWETNLSSLQYIGLLNSSNLLDSSKLSTFTNGSNYFTILDELNVDIFLYAQIKGLESNTVYGTFGAQSGIDSVSSTYTCYGEYLGEPTKILVEAWK